MLRRQRDAARIGTMRRPWIYVECLHCGYQGRRDADRFDRSLIRDPRVRCCHCGARVVARKVRAFDRGSDPDYWPCFVVGFEGARPVTFFERWG